MQELETLTSREEIRVAREEMAKWYAPSTLAELCSYLTSIKLAPGVEEGFSMLRRHGIKIAIVSITWEFAVEWFAKQLGADHYVGTRLLPDHEIVHFWPSDKPIYLTRFISQLGLTRDEVAAVGNSSDDIDMLRAAGYRFFVGRKKPERLGALSHYPDGNILQVSEAIVRIG
jgi:phosphoserine phosphatase